MGTHSVSVDVKQNAGKICITKSSEHRFSALWSGFVVYKLKFVFVSTLRDKFISLGQKVVSLVFSDIFI